MKSMKALVLVIALVGVASISFGQAAGPAGGVKPAKAGKGGPGGGMNRVNRMAEMEDKVLAKLSLTDKQKKEVVALRASQKSEVEALMKKYQGQMKPPVQGQKYEAPAGMREDMQKVQKEHADGMLKILGAEKFAQYKKGMEELRKSFGGPGGAGRKAGGKGKTPPPQN